LFPTGERGHFVGEWKALPELAGSGSVFLEGDMTVRKSAGVLPFILVLTLFQPLKAQMPPTSAWSPDRPDSHAPLSITDDRTLMEGQFEFGIRYFNQRMNGLGFGGDSVTVQSALNSYWATPTKMLNQGAQVDLMYGVTDALTLTASGTFVHKEMTNAVLDLDDAGWFWLGSTQAFGPEDVKVSALYKVLDRGHVRFHIHGGVSIPLGLTDFDDFTLDPTDPLGAGVEVNLPYHHQLGSGTFDVLPGFTASVQNEKASLGVQWKGTIRLSKNDRDWALGDLYEGALWAGYKGSDWVSVTFGALYSSWGNVEGRDAAVDASTSLAYDHPSYYVGKAGWRVDVPLGLNFIIPSGIFEGHRLALEYLFPVTQDLEYPQLRHDRTLTLGWQADFGF
jgi:hypothetical protein